MIRPLQSLRFLFILLIIASHANLLGLPSFDAGGDCAVAFFFMLSGYVTMLSKGESLRTGQFDHKVYLLRNIKKIYPLYFVAWFLFVVYQHNTTYLINALPSLLLIQSWVPNADIYFGGNPVGWFVSTLALDWVMLPFLYRLLQCKLTLPIILSLYLIYASMIPVEGVNAWLYVFPPVRVVDFMLGMALYQFGRQCKISRMWYLGIAGTICSLMLYSCIPAQIHTALLFWPWLSMVIASHDHIPYFAGKVLNQPWLVALGNATMAIYLLHLIIMKIIAYLYLYLTMR